MSKRVNKLLGLEIDEVSLVDRPANQHGLVTITKRDEGPVDEIFDLDGNPIDPADLRPGDTFLDAEGNEFEAMTQDDWEAYQQELEEAGIDPESIEGEYEDEGADERELAGVGKSAASAVSGGASTAYQAGKKLTTRTLRDLQGGFRHGRAGVRQGQGAGNERAALVGQHVGRNAARYGIGAASAGGGFVGGRRGVKKNAPSLGESVLTELSKAYTDGDRDQVVSKAIAAADSRAAAAERRANVAISKAAQLEEARELEGYVELAKSYELPVDPDDLGPILQTIAKSGLSEQQLDLVDRIFTAAGEQVLYGEIGAAGIAPSSVEEVIKAQALELVGKADMTTEQATVALFENDDRAYLEYLAETGH